MKWNLQKEKKALNNIISDPKTFYSFVKAKTNLKTGIGPLEDENGKYTNE